MKKIAGILVLGILLGAHPAYGQVAKFFSGGGPVAGKADLLKIYSGVESQIPKWKAEAKAMQPHPEDLYAVGKMVEMIQKDLLKTLNDLHGTLEAAKNEDFANPWEVAFIECRVGNYLQEVNDSFDSYAASLGASSVSKAETGKILTQQVLDMLKYATDSRVLRTDLENRLHDMAVQTEKKP